jgi:hypothetical protein
MKKILVLGILASVLAATHVAANAKEPHNPASAPVAQVDRYSDKAGILLMRSKDSRLPGPNRPIDYDKQPLNTLGLSPGGKSTLYYHLDVQSKDPAPVYVAYRNGESQPVSGQLPIIDTLPGEDGYNDFRQVWKIWVPASYMANELADVGAVKASRYKLEKTTELLNMAVVPDGSRARVRFGGGENELRKAWYRGQIAKYFLFAEAPLSVVDGEVPVSPIYDGFTINPGEPGGEAAFQMEPNTLQTHNVVATIPGDTGYSPLWLRVVYDSTAWGSVHDLDSALSAKIVPAKELLINCPVVSIAK